MNQKQKIQIVIIGAIFFLIAIFLPQNWFLSTLLYISSYIIIGGKVIKKAFKNIFNGQIFDENFLMVIATLGAFLIKEYPEAVAVMLFFQIGELFEHYAVDQSRKSISSLMDIRPDYAFVLRDDVVEKVEPDEVELGEIIVIKPGERIPLDAEVIQGDSMVDTSALTGVPRSVHVGDILLSGCINLNGVLHALVKKEFYDSTVNKILDLVENASNKKSNSENFISKFARYYTPFVVFAALFLAVIPPIIFQEDFGIWFYRALTFLVISCPCALVISVPLSFFGGIGAASKFGVLIKGSNYLEALAKTDIVVFDKTGTITEGVFEVQEIHSETISSSELLKLCAYVESGSNHPIAQSIIKAYGKNIESQVVEKIEELVGYGLKAVVDGKEIFVGNLKLMNQMNIKVKKENFFGTVVYVAIDKVYAGCIVISDKIKDDAKEAIISLKEMRISKTVMLSGDHQSIVQHVSNLVGIDQAYYELLPQDKVDKVEQMLSEKNENKKLVYVGDGINDAPVLARADIGIAMGGLGSDAAMEAADIVIMSDEPSKISKTIKLSKRTLSIVYQNIIFALGVKFLVLILGALGIANMWLAVFADVGVSVIAILNAMRVFFAKSKD